MRLPWPALTGAIATVLVGGAGLVRGLLPESVATPSGGAAITVTGAFVRAPIPPTPSAVAYFTVSNPTNTPDRLLRVTTGAGATAVLHTAMMSDGMGAVAATGVVIPAHGRLVLSAGGSHVMIEQLFGRLRAGQTVDIEVDFDRAGLIDVVAPVIAYGAPVPTAQPSGAQSSQSPSGAHS